MLKNQVLKNFLSIFVVANVSQQKILTPQLYIISVVNELNIKVLNLNIWAACTKQQGIFYFIYY